MSFLTDAEIDSLAINKMIFHVVGKNLEVPILLSEIAPPQHVDFFLERIKASLNGNLFAFSPLSNTERILRIIKNEADENDAVFSEQSKLLASDFQSRHSGNTSMGVFFLFELNTLQNEKLYALIKYDNEDVVRYVLDDNADEFQVPKLERFHESFVRKAEAMQKIALVRLSNEDIGGQVIVRDRSKRTNISVYFEGFLQVKRLNSDQDLCEKLIKVLKKVFKDHRAILPETIQKSGVNKIYEVLNRAEQDFNPDDPSPLLISIFGPHDESSPIRKTFIRETKNLGISGESFKINPDYIEKPKRRKIETAENVVIVYDEENRPDIKTREDGRKEITVITAGIVTDDIDTSKNQRSN
ncbi:nucleoid-associated protein [Serratia sp. root2]|uniref:nucleoid-associated protein n=1 Tax=Serratia sp. root2 TaxID=3059676 RepID=UPI00289222FE|nr:nucleoid-associated protein [Serratia sp. root2]MDT3251692.1 nucleoid-associated protein [Serratia sp. root2]